MLRAVVWKITGRPMSGTIAAAWVGRARPRRLRTDPGCSLTQSGALGATQDHVGGMDTVTDALLAAILAIIWTRAGNSLRMARLREHLPEPRAARSPGARSRSRPAPLSRRRCAVPTSWRPRLVRSSTRRRRTALPRPRGRHRRRTGAPPPRVAVSGLSAQDLTDGHGVAELAGEALRILRATPANRVPGGGGLGDCGRSPRRQTSRPPRSSAMARCS